MKGSLFAEDDLPLEPPMARGQSIANRMYPKPIEMLLINPFAKAKAAKKGKKKKKWS